MIPIQIRCMKRENSVRAEAADLVEELQVSAAAAASAPAAAACAAAASVPAAAACAAAAAAAAGGGGGGGSTAAAPGSLHIGGRKVKPRRRLVLGGCVSAELHGARVCVFLCWRETHTSTVKRCVCACACVCVCCSLAP